jgi:alginate O-acetyltransferase complex protein AlgI
MLLNSFQFIFLFLPITALVYAVLAERAPRPAAQVWLLTASLFFYAYGHINFLPLLAGSILFNWWISRHFGPTAGSGAKSWLIAGLAGDLLFLGVFKYLNFFLDTLAALTGWHPRGVPSFAFPTGISFFTLTQVMYLVDSYQGFSPPSSLFDHATMVSLFPYIGSGPLVSARAMTPQFQRAGELSADSRAEKASRGLYIFALGLAKKVIIADSFAFVADAGFAASPNLPALEAWLSVIAFTLQIYFDFSGYSEMAIGSALLLGIDIPQNFNAPFRSTSISEFWRRWHISLSNFITNYLFTPILRSFGKATLTTSAISVLLAMGIAGLWHGAAWTFVMVGLIHGTALAIHQVWKKRKLSMPNWLGWLLTMLVLNVADVFFRSPSMGFAFRMLRSMLPLSWSIEVPVFRTLLSPDRENSHILMLAFALTALLALPALTRLAAQFRTTGRAALATVALLLVSFLFVNSTAAKAFLYFGF